MVCLSQGISRALSGWTYLHLRVRLPVLLTGGPWESAVGGAFTTIAEPKAPLEMTMSDLMLCYNEFVIVTSCCQSYQVSSETLCSYTGFSLKHVRKNNWRSKTTFQWWHLTIWNHLTRAFAKILCALPVLVVRRFADKVRRLQKERCKTL